MCLFNSKEAVEKFLKRKKGIKTVTCYKKLSVNNYTNKLVSPFRGTTYKIGINRSNSEVKKPVKRDCEINRGIHVYNDKKGRNNTEDTQYVKVECLVKDLIGVDGVMELVFKKIFLSEKEYKNALDRSKRCYNERIKKEKENLFRWEGN